MQHPNISEPGPSFRLVSAYRHHGRRMSAAMVAVALACISAGCVAPSAIKNASARQLEGILEARQTAAQHQALAEDLFTAAGEIERDAAVVHQAVIVVDRLAPAGNPPSENGDSTEPGEDEADAVQPRCRAPIHDPSAATDCVAAELFRLRAAQAAAPGRLTGPLEERTRVESRVTVAFLDLLYRSHALIHEYINTDIGPSDGEISEIRSLLEGLLKRDGEQGGGS